MLPIPCRKPRPRVEGEREAEILDATLDQLGTVGYDRLTMDAVAAAGKASKATLYRRWSTKAELVMDAIERAKGAPSFVDPDTGSLRDDLLQVACVPGGLSDTRTVSVLAGVVSALHHDHEFAELFHQRMVAPKMAEFRAIFERAQSRGEVDPDVDVELLTPLLAAIILHRSFILRLATDDLTAARIIDEIVMPAATRRTSATSSPAPMTTSGKGQP